MGETTDAFRSPSTRDANELTGNITMDRGLSHFTEGLSEVFLRMAKALKPGAPLVFTYHHNTLEAYYPIAVSVLDAGLTCSASLPCPAEMGASIHINRTGSSIVDTVFVCRSTGKTSRRWIVETTEEIAGLIRDDVKLLRSGNITPTRGDIRCIVFGHLIRLAIWRLKLSWNRAKSIEERLEKVTCCIQDMGGLSAVEQHFGDDLLQVPKFQGQIVKEDETLYRMDDDEISF